VLALCTPPVQYPDILASCFSLHLWLALPCVGCTGSSGAARSRRPVPLLLGSVHVNSHARVAGNLGCYLVLLLVTTSPVCQAFPGPVVRRTGPVPASFACTLTQANDPLPLLACSVGAGITSRLTRLLDIWPSVCGPPSSRPLACWLGRPDRPAARQRLTSPIFTDPLPTPPDRIHTSTVPLPLALQRASF